MYFSGKNRDCRGNKMKLTIEQIEELQEQIILIYRAINQDKMFKRFFYDGSDVTWMPKNKDSIINKLNELEDPEDLLKKCIIELEEIKKGESFEDGITVHEIISSIDLEYLYKKYDMKNPQDIEKLDIKRLLNLL